MPGQTTGGPEAAELQRLLAPPIQAALLAAQQAHAAASNLLLVLVLPPHAEAACGLDVRVLAHALAGPPDASPATAVVLGGPRTVPVGKVSGCWEARGHAPDSLACHIWLTHTVAGHRPARAHLPPRPHPSLNTPQDSGWVAERRPLEALRPPGAGEVLLCSQHGRLLEGLVTNLFVVAPASLGSAAGSGGASGTSGDGEHGGQASTAVGGASAATFDPSALVVYTAGMADGVVWGTARARVLQACRRLGLAVREEAPDPRLRASWSEAFLTNSLRLVQPLACIACGAANVWGLPPWELRLPQAPGPVTVAVRAALEALQACVCAAELGAYSPPPGLAGAEPTA